MIKNLVTLLPLEMLLVLRSRNRKANYESGDVLQR